MAYNCVFCKVGTHANVHQVEKLNGLLRTTNLELPLLKCLHNFLLHYAIYVAKKYCIVMNKFQSVEASTLIGSLGVQDSILFFAFFHSNFSQTGTEPESRSKRHCKFQL